MIIGINGYEAVIPRFGYDKNGLPNRVGSSEVAFQIIKQLAVIDKNNEYIIYLPKKPAKDMPQESSNWKYKIIPDTKLWTIIGLNKSILREKLDEFFSPTHYGLIHANCPEILSVLDVSYKLFPEMFKKKDLIKFATWGKYSIKKASKILTISESSKRDIIKEYGVNESKVKVIYPGVKEVGGQMNKEEFIKKYNIKNPYILFVGTLQPRKNIVRLIEAFSRLPQGPGAPHPHPTSSPSTSSGLRALDEGSPSRTTLRELELIIVGRRGWEYEEILKAPLKFGVEEKVRFIEDVTDDALPQFYNNAELFVMPSLYEGFGLPILEAMKNDCPVAASNISSLPEAGGDAALYFNPEDSNDIARSILKVITSRNIRDDMVKKGREQVKKFSWEKSAREVLKVFEEVKGLKR